MLFAFSLLGLGAIVALAMSLFDGGDAESDTTEAEQTTFGSEDDTVASTGYSGAINTLFDSLVAEGEVTEAEAEAALAQVDFVTGTLNVATQAGDDGVLGHSSQRSTSVDCRGRSRFLFPVEFFRHRPGQCDA
jgi:hypothetical protein